MAKTSKRIKLSKTYSTAFVCVSILLIGTFHLLMCGDMGFEAVYSLILKLIPASLVMGFLGYKIGDILDHPKKDKVSEYKNLIMDELESIGDIDAGDYSTDFPDFGEINAKLISEGQAEEPKMELTEESSE